MQTAYVAKQNFFSEGYITINCTLNIFISSSDGSERDTTVQRTFSRSAESFSLSHDLTFQWNSVHKRCAYRFS